MCEKMADVMHEDIGNAVNTIASATKRNVNRKLELKHTIYETKYIEETICNTERHERYKTRAITELETLVASTKVMLEGVSCGIAKEQPTPSVVPRREPAKPPLR
jgi:hypothetical protein